MTKNHILNMVIFGWNIKANYLEILDQHNKTTPANSFEVAFAIIEDRILE